jgi:ATP-binding cassette subfamily F protein 3
MVSHDRHLLASVTDRFLLVDAGSVQEFDGDLDDYARWLSKRNDTVPAAATDLDAAQKAAPQQRRRDNAEARKALAPLRSRLARCEKRMQELATQAQQLDVQLADPGLYAVSERKRQLDLTAQRARIAQETEGVESEWLEISEELERAQAAG